MAGTSFDNQPAPTGGLSYTAPEMYLGSKGPKVVGGGFQFDIPLAAIDAFTNRALMFTKGNQDAAFGFVSGTVTRGQTAISDTSSKVQTYLQGVNASMFSHAEAINAKQAEIAMYAQNQATERTRVQASRKVKGGCFITTAVCAAEGKADDCYELETLRAFRDRFMMAEPAMRKKVDEYYRVAPRIVELLESNPEKGRQAYAEFRRYIDAAIRAIERGNDASAYLIYCRAVRRAASLALES